MKKTERGENHPAGLWIRFEVMNAIYHNPLRPEKLPSAAELAEKFDISDRTVVRELKKLAAEGYVTSRQGIGTFTNPKTIPFLADGPGQKIIGIICGDGRNLFEDYPIWAFLSFAGLALMPDIGHPRCTTLTVGGPEPVYQEVCALGLDGLIWIWPPPELFPVIRKLQRQGLPVVTIMNKVPGIPCIKSDNLKAGREMAKRLDEQKKSFVLWCAFDPVCREQLDGARQFYRERRIEPPRFLEVADWAECQETLTTLIGQNQLPDAVYVHGESLYPILSLLKHYKMPSTADCCFLVESNILTRFPEVNAIARAIPFEQAGRKAAEWMRTLLAQPDAPADQTDVLEYQITLVHGESK